MKFRRFIFNKLVRDNIEKEIIKSGCTTKSRVLDSQSYIFELKRKLIEEAAELCNTNIKDELLEEIADVQEIIDCILNEIGYSKKTMQKEQKRKNDKKGSFSKKNFIDYIECDENYEWINYYINNSDKYPEM